MIRTRQATIAAGRRERGAPRPGRAIVRVLVAPAIARARARVRVQAIVRAMLVRRVQVTVRLAPVVVEDPISDIGMFLHFA